MEEFQGKARMYMGPADFPAPDQKLSWLADVRDGKWYRLFQVQSDALPELERKLFQMNVHEWLTARFGRLSRSDVRWRRGCELWSCAGTAGRRRFLRLVYRP